ncbi:hypothetical protein DVH24_035316 [Malus domestica]|uniref:Uncharacterized protein n=1 Tax=Malus domestica TaxID=3750 RepID=A0A498J9N3_MALDO|nr:hypothetical protein DVH24_035316 [Malus domestica]
MKQSRSNPLRIGSSCFMIRESTRIGGESEMSPYPDVPSEGDVMMVSAEENVVLQGKTKWKKKKQVTTPRPACSWVYFSRDFIKEYSASHPESSGLKAATKAASDAWKSMSLDEKEKYTRRAREVWDNYLSTAPTRTPKPRKQLFYYESISVEENGALAPALVPSLSSWGEDEITEREKRERELGGYGCGEVVCKERCLDLDSCEFMGQLDRPPPACSTNHGVEDDTLLEHKENKENMLVFVGNKDIVCGDIELVVESVRTPCRNREYGCEEIVDYMKNIDHEETCIYAPCPCPLPDCNFVSSFEQLSLHFSSKHWDSGRRFRYNTPLAVSLGINEQFLVLQAEEDGALFLLNKGTESIGNTIMITSIRPISSGERFAYDLVSIRGSSSLRLKSVAENFPGGVEGFRPMDYLLVPFCFLTAAGQLNLDVCIQNSSELGAYVLD